MPHRLQNATPLFLWWRGRRDVDRIVFVRFDYKLLAAGKCESEHDGQDVSPVSHFY